MCGEKARRRFFTSISNPSITDMTTIKIATPKATPSKAAAEMIEKKFLNGLRYLRARVELKDFLAIPAT